MNLLDYANAILAMEKRAYMTKEALGGRAAEELARSLIRSGKGQEALGMLAKETADASGKARDIFSNYFLSGKIKADKHGILSAADAHTAKRFDQLYRATQNRAKRLERAVQPVTQGRFGSTGYSEAVGRLTHLAPVGPESVDALPSAYNSVALPVLDSSFGPMFNKKLKSIDFYT